MLSQPSPGQPASFLSVASISFQVAASSCESGPSSSDVKALFEDYFHKQIVMQSSIESSHLDKSITNNILSISHLMPSTNNNWIHLLPSRAHDDDHFFYANQFVHQHLFSTSTTSASTFFLIQLILLLAPAVVVVVTVALPPFSTAIGSFKLIGLGMSTKLYYEKDVPRVQRSQLEQLNL